MEQIKKVFSPGSTKDDEIMYGDPQTRIDNSASHQAQHDTSQLHPVDPSSNKESGGLLRQILNPGGNKHDERAYGTTATTAEPESDPSKLRTDPDHKDSGITRQILNPGGNKYDETAHGTTATATAPESGTSDAAGTRSASTSDPNTKLVTQEGKEDRSILKQIFNPGRSKYDETAHGTTAQEVKTDNPQHATSESNTGRDAALGGSAAALGGAAAYGATRGRDENTTPATSVTQQHGPSTTTNTTTTTTTSTSTLPSRPADSHHPGPSSSSGQTSLPIHDQYSSGGLGSIGVRGQTDGLADGRTSNQAAQQQSGAHGLGRDAGMSSTSGIPPTTAQKLESGSGVPGSSTAAGVPASGVIGSQTGTTSGSGYTEQLSAGQSRPSHDSHGHVNPVGAPQSQSSQSDSNAGLAGGVAAAGAAAAHGVHNEDRSAPTQLNRAPDDVQGATYLDRSYYMGTSPHVPGEFPTSTGEDPHGSATSTTTDPNIATAGAATAMRSHDPTVSSATTTTSASQPGIVSPEKDHTGRNAAVAGGALGAGALGGSTSQGAGARDRDAPITQSLNPQQTSGISSQSQQYDPSAARTTAPVTGVPATTVHPDSTQPQTQDHHHGRDAAIAGGAGAVGAGGLYAATRDRDEPSTTLHSSQSHSGSAMAQSSAPATHDQSNRTLEHHSPQGGLTSGSTAPGVTQQRSSAAASTTAKPEEHHYGRDAAIAGGAGAAGAGGVYAATRDRDPAGDTTHDAYGTEDPNRHNKLHKESPDEKKLEKEHAKEEKKLEKEHAKEEKKLEKEQAKEEKQHEKEQAKEEKKLEKEHHKEEKERQRAAEKAQKKVEKEHQKEVEKAEKKHDKELAAAAHKHDKEEEKAAEKRQKEAEKHSKEEEKEKKPSLIDRILHPGRHSEDKEHQSVDDEHTKQYLQPDTTHLGATSEAPGGQAPPTIAQTSNSLNHPLIAPVEPGTSSNTMTGPHSGSGTQAGQQAGQQAVAGPDHDAINKANAPY